MKYIRIFFIDEHNSSMHNGIGTFRDILLPLIAKLPKIKVSTISLNYDCKSPVQIIQHYGTEYAIPTIGNGQWRIQGSNIVKILKKSIRDSKYNIFMINHSPCADFIDILKKSYPKSKVTFTIHNQGWCDMLLGSKQLFHKIVYDNTLPDEVTEETATYVKNYTQQELAIYDKVDAVICLSNSTEEHLKTIYKIPEHKIHNIANGYINNSQKHIRKTTARKLLGIREDEKLLVFVGRPSKYKGLDALLQAIAFTHKQYPNMRCALIGTMKGFADFWYIGKTIASKLICTDHLSQKELSLWYAAADIGLLPSYSEQCSLSALEMMNAGLTIVASDGNGLGDMFKNARNAFVAKIGNVLEIRKYAEEISKALKKALDASNTKIKQMRAYNRSLIKSDYSANNMVLKYENLFRSIINDKSSLPTDIT